MKKTEANLITLNIIFCISIVIANVVGCKIINTGVSLFGIPLATSGGAITYAFTFLCTDIIGEIWGKEEANRSVKKGFMAQIFAIVLIVLTQYTPTDDARMQQAYVTLLGQSPYFVAGSLCAYLCSQNWDVWIFHKIRDKFITRDDFQNWRWVWNNVGTMTSQIIDTVIYTFVSFGLGFGWLFDPSKYKMMLSIIMGQYLLKFCLAAADTPFFYAFTNSKNR